MEEGDSDPTEHPIEAGNGQEGNRDLSSSNTETETPITCMTKEKDLNPRASRKEHSPYNTIIAAG